MPEFCKLPDNFAIGEYLLAFKQLAPIDGIKVGMPDDVAVYTSNCAFMSICETLKAQGLARKKGNAWIILNSAKEQLVNKNVLPIAIHSGANIAFVNSFTE
jgi:hypothetical protein